MASRRAFRRDLVLLLLLLVWPMAYGSVNHNPQSEGTITIQMNSAKQETAVRNVSKMKRQALGKQ